jgi:uncharacterized protein (TIGR02996 family)
MVDSDIALVALTSAVCENVSDVTARLALADWYEENDKPKMAKAQRELAGLGCYATPNGHPDEDQILANVFDWIANGDAEQLAECENDDSFCVKVGFDEDLLVWWFRAEWETGIDETFVTCGGRGDLPLAVMWRKAGL